MRGAGAVVWARDRGHEGGAAGAPERSCVTAVLSCGHNSEGAGVRVMVVALSMLVNVDPGGGVLVMVIAVLMFVNVDLRGAAGEAGWKSVVKIIRVNTRGRSVREGVSSK